ncbi:hypothetical protein [Pseudonocardia thermophila]|uniref:hypothetical protein n=1 Tax=Pseudonocardia thermophila TaxID=1848 RepID=UPI00248ED0F8|nr:hypothetical protein [Pseudonocardia thermophila]
MAVLDQAPAAAPHPPAPLRRRWPRALAAAVAVAVPTLLFVWHATAYGAWEIDDAGITFAYARSVATGHGPVLQPGQPPVEGFSNPAWLALLVVGRWLGLFDHGTWFGVPDYVAYPKALATVLVAGTFAAFHAAATVLSRRPALVTILAGGITASIPSFVIWCVSGLENSLLVFAVVTAAAVAVRAHVRGALATWQPAVACGLLAALAALTRPEGPIYAALYPIAALLLARPVRAALGCALVSVVAFAVPAGAYLAYRLTTFGEWLPTTAVAKSQGLPTVEGFAKVTELVGYAGWLGVLVGVVLVGAALAGPARDGLVILLVPLGLGLVAYGVLVPDWMGQHRFASPVWALGAVVVALAAVEVVERLGWRGRIAAGTVGAVALVLSGAGWIAAGREFRAEPVAPMCLIVVNSGYEFNAYLQALGRTEGTLFAPELGGTALVGTAIVTDGGGLAEPVMARYWRTKDTAGVRDYVLEQVRPTFLKAHGEFRPFMGFDDDPRFQADYVEIGPTPNNGANWVRRDALTDPGALDRLRAVAAEALAADAAQRATPRASCGDVLTPGSTGPIRSR